MLYHDYGRIISQDALPVNTDISDCATPEPLAMAPQLHKLKAVLPVVM
jgi:hypothetical protein